MSFMMVLTDNEKIVQHFDNQTWAQRYHGDNDDNWRNCGWNCRAHFTFEGACGEQQNFCSNNNCQRMFRGTSRGARSFASVWHRR